MVGPDSHNREEERFVEELSTAHDVTHYLRGVGVKGLRFHQLQSIPRRLASRNHSRTSARLRLGSLAIIPVRRVGYRLNSILLRRQLENIMGSHDAAWWIWIRFPSPELVDALDHLPSVQLAYEPIDLYPAADDLSDGEARRLAEAEQRLVRRATVVTGGIQLAERFRHASGGSKWLPFGLDEQQPDRGPGIAPAIACPRIGLVGCLDWRVDEALLVSVMTEHLDWQLVLAGPRVDLWGRRLKTLPNVHWLGRVPVERVRPIIRDCDVTIIPYRLNDWTRHCFPVKVFEYLADGKPVVATPLPELDLLRDVVTIASPQSFAHAIERALAGDTSSAQERRREAAHRFTLQDRARRATEILQSKALEAAAR
jgi:glycosyltransferase involved in cell wall biosynthesis